ncbi:hypothetical protein KKH16_02140 [Patescibacteria group bacterium]|nr:hypothetical protein [Patescibacteria group bacterium]MBU1870797.1 hypothetical protein [Patescibacteria group bacterium]
MTNKKTIYIFGNPLLCFDNLPIKLAPKLKKAFQEIDFIIQDPNENLKPKNNELIIIDTVVGLKKVTIINSIKKIELSPTCSMHDFDLGFNLKLLKKIGKLKKIIIFGIPTKIDEEEALKQLINLINVLRP